MSLVGAGPGDPGLMTRKAARRIAEADVIVHEDSLPSPLLADARPDADVFPRSSLGSSPDAVLELLTRSSRRGRRVVRLFEGDPLVCGTGAEEALALCAAGIEIEIVPGVTAGTAVPAYAGIPLTGVLGTQGATFLSVSARRDVEAGPPGRWEALCRADCTIVAFVDGGGLREIVTRLCDAGANPRTPAAIIEHGTTPVQRTVEGDLSDILDRAEHAGVGIGQAGQRAAGPSLVLVVGRVASLRHQMRWFDRRPLFGRRVLVTRASDQAPPLVEALREQGAGVVVLPVLEFGPPSDSGFLDHAIEELRNGRYDWVVFTSANGVKHLFEALFQRGLDLRSFAGARVACVGPATAEALVQRGIRTDLVPEEYRAEGLLEALDGQSGIRGNRFLVPRAEVGREVLPDTLRARGGIVDVAPVYRTLRPATAPGAARMFVDIADTVTFTSPSSVSNLTAMLGEEAIELLRGRMLAAIGPITARALQEVGLEPEVVARSYTVQGLVDALVEHAG